MKKVQFGMIILIVISQKCFAQDGNKDLRSLLQLGLKAGTNYSDVSGSQGESFKSGAKIGVAAGAFVSIPFGTLLGIQSEVLFSQKGFQATGALLGSPYDLTRTTIHLDIPLCFAIKPIRHLTILVGPQLSYLLKERNIFTNTVTSVQQEKEFNNTNIRKYTLGYISGVDLNVNRFMLSTRAGLDVQNYNGDGTSTTLHFKNIWVQFALGFKLL